MDWSTPGLGLRIGGHRGAAAEAPENTFAGFERAEAAGVDYIETDVQLSADGHPLVFHDDALDRTTDGTGAFASATADHLLALDAGAWFDRRFRGERIPTLDGFLAWLARRPGLGATIEAKGPGSGMPIARAIGASPVRAHLSICSFSADELRMAASVDESIRRILIADRDRPEANVALLAAAAGAAVVNVPLAWLDRRAVHGLHAAGLLVAAGTIDDETGISACLDLGVDFVDSNHPSLTVAARRALAGTGRGTGLGADTGGLESSGGAIG